LFADEVIFLGSLQKPSDGLHVRAGAQTSNRFRKLFLENLSLQQTYTINNWITGFRKLVTDF